MKVLATRRLPGPAWAELDDVEYLAGSLPEALAGTRPDVEALAPVSEVVDESTLRLLPNLRLVANYGVGYDSIDVAACHAHGVAVTNTPGVLDAAVADMTLALILAVWRRLVEGDRLVRERRWQEGWAGSYLIGGDLDGATLGIVGLGNIGQAVARRAAPFGLRLLYTQRTRLPPQEEAALGVAYRPLDDLLSESDLVTIHVPLTPETRGLIDLRRLARMRDGAALVNTARGAVVDEAALVDELRSGRLHAALDVFAAEPDVPAHLLALPNVVLTPHIGSATHATRAAMTRIVVDNLLALAAGRPLLTPV